MAATFKPKLTSPLGSTVTNTNGALGTARKIIIHHTAGNSIPNPIPYHFVVDKDGKVYYGVDTTYRSGATNTKENNDNAIQIAAVGNWHDFNDMSQAQKDSLKNIIIDCLWSFTGISRTNRFNLPAQYISHIGNASRDKLDDKKYHRHRNEGIYGHDDCKDEATLCPGKNLYAYCRDSIVPDAIFWANNAVLE